MPRTARVVAVAAPHHVTQRGSNRQQIFFSDVQRRYYLSLLAVQSRIHELRILGYCLMPNHVHLVAVPGREDSLAKAVGRANNAYSRYFNQVGRDTCGRTVSTRPRSSADTCFALCATWTSIPCARG